MYLTECVNLFKNAFKSIFCRPLKSLFRKHVKNMFKYLKTIHRNNLPIVVKVV